MTTTKEMESLVTIAIPTYNRAGSYLPQALKSALVQTYPNIEVIVSDNCSTDDTESLVASFDNPRVRYIRHPNNMGPVKNFAFCLEQARGKYFLLLHDDDLIDPDFIETCINAVSPGVEVGIIRTGTRAIDSEGKVLCEIANQVVGLSTDGFFRAWFAGTTAPYLCSTLFHTERLRRIGGLRSKHYHFDDVMAEVQLAALFGRIDVQDVKASFRYHDAKRGNLRLTSAAEVKNWCEDSLLLLDLMCRLVSQNRALVREEGMRFFSGLCYRYSGIVKSPLQRFLSYLVVFKSFRYRYPPPPVVRFLRRSLFYRGIRKVNSGVKRFLYS